jgi:hypothetical protein
MLSIFILYYLIIHNTNVLSCFSSF